MAGELDQRVTLKPPVKVTNTFGEKAEDHAAGAGTDCWAKVEQMDARKFWFAQQVTADVSHLVTIRFRSDVTHEWRVLWRGLEMNVEKVLRPDPRGDRLTLACKAKVA